MSDFNSFSGLSPQPGRVGLRQAKAVHVLAPIILVMIRSVTFIISALTMGRRLAKFRACSDKHGLRPDDYSSAGHSLLYPSCSKWDEDRHWVC